MTCEEVFPGIWVHERFAQEVLGFDPAELQRDLEKKYPVRGAGDRIEAGQVQWVDGDNQALKYRGNTLKRGKIWLQRPVGGGGYRRYGYTGWQWRVLPATADLELCPEVVPIADRYDEWAETRGYPASNHYIVTKYQDGDHFIGKHSDKIADIAEGSLITVVKTGSHGRPFQLFLGDEKNPFFERVLAPGTALVMTIEANLATKHAVPVVKESGSSGSVVFRTIKTVIGKDDLERALRKRERED